MKKKTALKICFAICLFIFLISWGNLIYNLINIYKDKKTNTNILEKIKVEKKDNGKSELLLKLEKLKEENSDIVGWISIQDTNINYPVLQTTDNDYYLSHNYLKESSKRGSIFLDKDVDLNHSLNYLIYGHRSKTKLMFEDLSLYTDEDFYINHPIINFATLEEERKYEIVGIFYSRIYYQKEKNVFRYYNYINLDNEEEYNYYIEQVKKASIYDTGVLAEYKEQLITLSTCEYSQNNGRLVIVAKKIDN